MKILTPPTQKEEIEIFKNLLLIDPNVTFDGIKEEKIHRWNDEVEDIFDAYYENITDFTNKSLCIQERLYSQNSSSTKITRVFAHQMNFHFVSCVNVQIDTQ